MRKTSAIFLLFTGLFLCALGFRNEGNAPAPATGIQFPATKLSVSAPLADATGQFSVVKVVDGDTIDISKSGENVIRVRLIGIDTPEIVDPRRPVECFGKESSLHMHEMLDHKTVRIETDVTQGIYDKYSRMLAYVYLEDGTFVNEKMIRDGYAHEYTYNTSYRFQKEFRRAERTAREEERGLWAPGVCGNTITQAAPPPQ